MKRTSHFLTLAAGCVALGSEPALAGWFDLMPRPFRQTVQYYGARRYTQRLAPQTGQPAPAAPPKPQPAAAPSAVPGQPPASGTAPVAAAPDKAKEEKDAVLKRTIEFQKKRAQEGSATAQFDLGKRYLAGDGLAKDLAEAKKWFEAAAKQEHVGAAMKLEEIRKLEAAAVPKAAKD